MSSDIVIHQSEIVYNVLTKKYYLNFKNSVNELIDNIINAKSSKYDICKNTYNKCEFIKNCNTNTEELYYFDPAKSKIILYMTPGALISGLIAYSRYKSVQAYAEFAVFVMSVLHWHDPQFGWRRNLDMITVQLSLWTHIWLFYQSGCFPAFILMMIALGCFYLSLRKRSFIMHGLGWLISCSSNLVLAYW